MSTDEITTFRDARPQVPPYDPAAKARLRVRLMNESAEPPPRTSLLRGLTLRQRLVTVGALTAALAVGITVVQSLEVGDRPDGTINSRGPLVLGPVANAADLAANAARVAAAEPDGTPRPDQWSYVKTVLATSSKGTGGALAGPPDRRLTREDWRSVDGKQSAAIEQGRLRVSKNSLMRMSPPSDYPYLLSLPAEPGALLAQVYQVVDKENGAERPTAEWRASRAFQVIEIWMRDAALPARLRAAMYGALAKIPGVRYQAGAADLAGRPGVTLYRVEEGYLRSEIMVNPKTYEYMGFRFVAVREHSGRGLDGASHAEKGQIQGWGALIKAAVVDRPGQRPG